MLGDVRKKILQITVSRTHHNQVGRSGLSDLSNDIDLTGHVNQRVVSRWVAIGGRIGGRPLNVRIVVGGTTTHVQDLDAQLMTQLDELMGLTQFVFHRLIRVG